MKKLEFNEKSSGQSWDVQRRVSNWTGKPETRFAKYVWQERRILGEKPLRYVALRCVVTRKKQRLVASIGEFRRRSARSEKGVQVFAKLGSIGRDASILSVLLMP